MLTLTGQRISDFAIKADVSRVSLRQVMDGDRCRYIPVDFAFRVAAASNGLIKAEDFMSSTAKRVPGKRRRRTAKNSADPDSEGAPATGTYG